MDIQLSVAFEILPLIDLPGNSQIPQCTCSISHNAPFRTEMCTSLLWMVHCGKWNRWIVRFVRPVYWLLVLLVSMASLNEDGGLLQLHWILGELQCMGGAFDWWEFLTFSKDHWQSFTSGSEQNSMLTQSHCNALECARRLEKALNSSTPWTKWLPFWQTTISNAFFKIKIIEFRFEFHLNLF